MRGLSPEGTAPLSAIVITCNEERNLRECLASVSFAREVVVVDSASTDATVAIATEMGARVVQVPDWPGFGPQKNRALDAATQDWVLSIDADERVSPELRQAILDAIGSDAPEFEAWEMPRRSSYCGQFMRHSGWYPDRVTRLFRRGSARFTDDPVHERLQVRGRVGRLSGDLVHHSFPDLESVLDKVNRYSSLGAERMLREGRHGSVLSAALHGFWTFVRTYFLRAGFLDGRMGFLLAVSNAEGAYYRYLKLWLLQNRR